MLNFINKCEIVQLDLDNITRITPRDKIFFGIFEAGRFHAILPSYNDTLFLMLLIFIPQ